MTSEQQVVERKSNRLTIGHLLLWITMTGVMLAWLQSRRPPKVEDVRFGGSYLTAGTEQERKAHYEREQRRVWRQLYAQHWLGFIASPLNGIVISAAVWSCYECFIRRFRFPSQPGHWLLLAMFVVLAAMWMRAFLMARGDRWVGEFVPLATACLPFAGIAAMNRAYAGWTLVFALLSIGCASLAIAWVLVDPQVYGTLIGECMLLISAFPFWVLACSFNDIFQRRRFDIFHWLGVGTLGGFAACIWGWIGFVRSVG